MCRPRLSPGEPDELSLVSPVSVVVEHIVPAKLRLVICVAVDVVLHLRKPGENGM